MSDDWKIDMLKKLWAGEDTDPNKSDKVKPTKKSKSANQKWTEIDLHHYHDLSDQIEATEKAIDKALLAQVNGILIIHGKGDGILRSEIIKLLKTQSKILEYKSVNDHYGESGAIRIRFK